MAAKNDQGRRTAGDSRFHIGAGPGAEIRGGRGRGRGARCGSLWHQSPAAPRRRRRRGPRHAEASGRAGPGRTEGAAPDRGQRESPRGRRQRAAPWQAKGRRRSPARQGSRPRRRCRDMRAPLFWRPVNSPQRWAPCDGARAPEGRGGLPQGEQRARGTSRRASSALGSPPRAGRRRRGAQGAPGCRGPCLGGRGQRRRPVRQVHGSEGAQPRYGPVAQEERRTWHPLSPSAGAC